MSSPTIWRLIWLAIMVLHAVPASADSTLRASQSCIRHFERAEQYHNIPSHWLAAIANAESGRYNAKLKMSLPWPWTINVGGKGYYFETKQQALAKIRDYMSRGEKSIDVGCMQVNLMYHGEAFSSIEQALEPRYNVAYAARFLRKNFDDMRSWKKATAAYHSRTPERGSQYFGRVFRHWEKVIKRLGVKQDSYAYFQTEELASLAPASGGGPRANRYQGFQVNADKKRHTPIKMKVIQVSDGGEAVEAPASRQANFARAEKTEREKSHENGVLVIRPNR